MSEHLDGGPLQIAVLTEDGTERSAVSAAELSALIAGLGAEGNHFAVAERVADDDGQVFPQTWRDGAAPYLVEVREAVAPAHTRVRGARSPPPHPLGAQSARGVRALPGRKRNSRRAQP